MTSPTAKRNVQITKPPSMQVDTSPVDLAPTPRDRLLGHLRLLRDTDPNHSTARERLHAALVDLIEYSTTPPAEAN